MKLTMHEIEQIINKQKEKVMIKAVDWLKGGNTKEQVKKFVQNEFLSTNDITDKSEEFEEGVDYDEVCNLRSEAMFDVILDLDLDGEDE